MCAVAAGLIAAATLAAGLMAAASAQEMKPPRLTHINPDWNAVAADLGAIGPQAAAPSQTQSLAPGAPSDCRGRSA